MQHPMPKHFKTWQAIQVKKLRCSLRTLEKRWINMVKISPLIKTPHSTLQPGNWPLHIFLGSSLATPHPILSQTHTHKYILNRRWYTTSNGVSVHCDWQIYDNKCLPALVRLSALGNPIITWSENIWFTPASVWSTFFPVGNSGSPLPVCYVLASLGQR